MCFLRGGYVLTPNNNNNNNNNNQNEELDSFGTPL